MKGYYTKASMIVETLIVLLCFNPEVNSIKQHYIDENIVVEVISGKPDEKCYYTKIFEGVPRWYQTYPDS